MLKLSDMNIIILTKIKIFIPISLGIAIIYGVAIFLAFQSKDKNDTNFYFYGDSDLNYIRFIHVGILFLMSCYICFKDIILLKFLKEKQSSDSANSWKITILMKTLLRFPIFGIRDDYSSCLYVFYIG